MLTSLRSTVSRILASIRHAQEDRQFNDEVQSHLTLLEERFLRQGMTLEEARREARRTFGGIEQVKELHRQARAIAFFHDIRQDVHVAVRSLLKHRGFTIVAVATLTLGVGATTAIFSVMHGILLKPLPYERADRIVSVWQTAKDNPAPSPGGSTSHLNYLDVKREAKSFESLALYGNSSFVLSGLGEAELIRGGIVTPDFFRVFKATPMLGREFTREEDLPTGPRVAVISHGFWRERLGGRPDVIGSTIELGSRPAEIVGVAPPGFAFPDSARIWIPIQNNDSNCGRGCVYTDGIARLRDGISLEQARGELVRLASALEQQYPDDNTNMTIALDLLQDDTVRNVRLALMLLMGAVALVLLIACANVANLVLVRGTTRQGEMAVRAALGGSRRRLLSYLCTENLVLALFGGASGLALAWWGVGALKRIAPADLPRLDELAFDSTTFLFALGLALITTLLFGLGPALQLSRSPLAAMLTTRGEVSTHRTLRSRSILVAVEVGLSLMLLIGAGLLLRSLTALQSVDTGFAAENVTIFTLGLPSARYPAATDVVRTFEEFDSRLSAVPGVTSVGYINGLPLGPGENVRTFLRPELPPPPPGQRPAALYRVVDSDYFRTLRIPLIRGRYFQPSDRAGGQPVIIISRTLAEQYFPHEDALGRVMQIDGDRMVVGIVQDIHSQSLERSSQPEMYIPHAQNGGRTTTFVIRSETPPTQVLSAIRQIVRERDRSLPVIRPGAMEQVVGRHVARPRFYMMLLTLFAALAVSLASIGTYGVVAYAVAQRTKEIGVRMALGARPSQLLLTMLWQGFRPAVLGIALGIGGSLVASRAITRLLFTVSATDPWTFATVTLLLVSLVVVASIVPAARAMRIPAATALRLE